MRKNFKKIVMMALGLLMALNLTACGSSDSDDTGTTTYKDVINVAVAQEAPTYDVHKTTSLIARQLFAGTVWEKLVTLNANSEAVPELATSFDMSEDAKTFTFHLREGVLFHDGSEMQADDAAASMNRWIEAYSQARALVGEGRFVVVDDYTIEITADQPALTLPTMMAGANQPAIVTTAEACADEDDAGNLKEYIGTGPYTFVEWVQDQYITFEKFDDYVPYYLADSTEEVMDGWAGYKHAYTKTLNFYYVAEEATRVAGLQTGQYDAIFSVSSDNYDMVASTSGLDIDLEQGGIVTAVFNKDEASLSSDINIRKAVNAIADSDEILTSAYGSFYDLGSCYMDEINGFWLTDAGSDQYNQKDEALAKQFLEDAGYNGETFRILTPTVSHFDNMGLVLKSELEDLGMTVELTTVDWATFTQYRTDPTGYDLYITSFSSVPLPTLKSFYGASYPGWTNDAHMTELLTAYNTATTLDDAYTAWEELQAYSWDYLPAINFGHYNVSYAWSDNLEGQYLGSGLYFWNATIAE